MDRKCAICRRAGQKLFLKGEKCFSPKCPMIRRPYAPGIFGKTRKTRKRTLSDYGIQFREKQNLKHTYGLRERQFKKHVKEARSGEDILKNLEMRLDNIVFRLGLARSRDEARQFVSHSHFLVNNRLMNIPSHHLKPGDIIRIKKKNKEKSKIFKDLEILLKKHEPPPWLSFNLKKLEGKVVSFPTPEDIALPFNLRAIVEFYSR